MVDDLEQITIRTRTELLIDVPGLNNYEAALILLLGSKGYTSNINAEKIYEIWDRVGVQIHNEAVEELTEGVRGMRLMDIAAELDIEYGRATTLVTKLQDRTKYVLKLSKYSSLHFFETDRRSMEFVLTQTGTELYGRIDAAVSAYKNQTNPGPSPK